MHYSRVVPIKIIFKRKEVEIVLIKSKADVQETDTNIRSLPFNWNFNLPLH